MRKTEKISPRTICRANRMKPQDSPPKGEDAEGRNRRVYFALAAVVVEQRIRNRAGRGKLQGRDKQKRKRKWDSEGAWGNGGVTGYWGGRSGKGEGR